MDCDEFGINPGDYLDYLAGGRGAKMASQPKLGLWTKRWTRAGPGDHPDSAFAGEDLDKRDKRNRKERKGSAKARKAFSLRLL